MQFFSPSLVTSLMSSSFAKNCCCDILQTIFICLIANYCLDFCLSISLICHLFRFYRQFLFFHEQWMIVIFKFVLFSPTQDQSCEYMNHEQKILVRKFLSANIMCKTEIEEDQNMETGKRSIECFSPIKMSVFQSFISQFSKRQHIRSV